MLLSSLKKSKLVLGMVSLLALQAQAEESFVDIMRAMTNNQVGIVSEIPMLDRLNAEATIDGAGQILINQQFEGGVAASSTAMVSTSQIDSLLSKRQLTLVIVPGLLGEFIETRAMEEVFAKDAQSNADWVKQAGNTMDERYSLKDDAVIQEKLSELINVATIKHNGKAAAKLVILKTKLGSLESVGDNAKIAANFNRRLEKYIKITGDKNIVLLGYSRGTPLALEMVTQAEKQNLSYLKEVKALVSYAGVVMGSSLANETDDTSSTNGKLAHAIETFIAKLQEGATFKNTGALIEMVRTLSENSSVSDVITLDEKEPSQIGQFIMTGDLRAVGFAFFKVADQLQLIKSSSARVIRLRRFFGDVLASVDGLKTKSLTTWWQTHTLPKGIKYMSIAAGMDESGYSKSLDDIGLKSNMRSYAKATNGVLMNDSQVAIHQAVFYPSIMKSLNAANDGLEIKQLGLLNTHHWGVSLQVVNKMRMKDDQYFNKFPRETVMKALSAFINQD